MKNIFNNIEIKDNYIFFHKSGDGWSSTSRWEISDFLIFMTVIILLTALVIYFICSYTKYLSKRNKLKNDLDFPVPLSEITAVNAKVIAKYTEMEKSGGSSFSHHRILYWAEFSTDNGKTVKYEIPQEVYDALTQYQTGTLATCDGEFFYFDDGDPIE